MVNDKLCLDVKTSTMVFLILSVFLDSLDVILLQSTGCLILSSIRSILDGRICQLCGGLGTRLHNPLTFSLGLSVVRVNCPPAAFQLTTCA